MRLPFSHREGSHPLPPSPWNPTTVYWSLQRLLLLFSFCGHTYRKCPPLDSKEVGGGKNEVSLLVPWGPQVKLHDGEKHRQYPIGHECPGRNVGPANHVPSLHGKVAIPQDMICMLLISKPSAVLGLAIKYGLSKKQNQRTEINLSLPEMFLHTCNWKTNAGEWVQDQPG